MTQSSEKNIIRRAIQNSIACEDLDYETAKSVMTEIMEGRATQAQIAAFLTAMRMKGETAEEITACATVMREYGLKSTVIGDVLDIVGTGGDEVGTFNISTTAAFVIASAGIKVAKHGNRSVSSKSGAADVLEQLGVRIDLTPEQNDQVLEECGIGFYFAPTYHSSMRHAAPVRKEMGARTIFNILGPLANPAAANYQVLGVYDPKLVELLAKVLQNLGVKRGFVVCGDGLDEFTVTGNNYVCEIRGEDIRVPYTLTPEEMGLPRYDLADILGGSPERNATITLGVLSGEIQGAMRDTVVLNAGMALYLAIDGITPQEGVRRAERLIDSGKALSCFKKMRQATHSFDT
jgi:anthranilate phosphoribosyltransferase